MFCRSQTYVTAADGAVINTSWLTASLNIRGRIKRDLTHVFQNFYVSRSLKCPLHIASYTLRIGVFVTELYGAEFVISLIFQRKRYIPIARTGIL